MEINTVNLVGRAGREPDVRYFESGSIVANFTLAVNRRSRDEEPDWFNLKIWGKQAQIAAKPVEQKSRIYTTISYSPEPKPVYNFEVVEHPRTISRLTSSGQKDWGIDIGTYPNRFTADKVLIKTALSEMISLEGSLRKVVKNKYGFRATFLGLSENKAEQACKRLRNRNISCDIISPG